MAHVSSCHRIIHREEEDRTADIRNVVLLRLSSVKLFQILRAVLGPPKSTLIRPPWPHIFRCY